MPIKILMPALSPTMEHGNLAKWTKKEGDSVKAGEVIAEIETDKATMEVEAVDEGVLAKIMVPEGAQEVPVNSLIGVLLEEDEDKAALAAFIEKESAAGTVASEPKKEEKPAPAASIPAASPSSAAPKTEMVRPAGARIFASPLAKRIAKMEGIALANVTGSGPHGRIIKADLLNIGTKRGTISRHKEEYRLVPNNNIRKIIAKRLVESKQTVPHFYLSNECMMDSVLEIRAQLNASFGDDKSKKLSVNDFVILATAKALMDIPEANASWSDDAIMMYNNVDISIAVAIDGGLITPVIRNADQKEITTISSEMKDLAKRARANSLKPEEFQGGGFSISNLGMYGVKSFNAIINPPQGCILAVGMSSKRAVVINDKIETRMIMDVNLSCDHRVVDGAVGALFLAAFKKYIESPILMFV
ncbi:MAG: pyruvate dehydrogenase complex dihydrolipoamide acetyltransferase [Rickettsiales bacterium]|nr:MAG: pyruvate dehydrogenase complex dihydrolipoamide acetyltransferase [Rickettsiales bacterium]